MTPLLPSIGPLHCPGANTRPRLRHVQAVDPALPLSTNVVPPAYGWSEGAQDVDMPDARFYDM
jgi:hypothetical protein